MDEEARLDAKIKKLQGEKKQLHAKQREELYRTVGEYFVDHNGQYAINDRNYKDFMLISPQGWKQLHTAANHMYRDINGRWRLQPGSQDDLNPWLAQHFRDDAKHHRSGSPSQKQGNGKVPIGDHLYTFPELGHKFHLNPEMLNARWYRGYRGKDLVRPAQKQDTNDKVLYLNGQSFTLQTLSQLYHVPKSIILERYYHGDRDADLVRQVYTSPRHPSAHRESRTKHYVTPQESTEHKRITFQGKPCTIAELSRKTGIKAVTLGNRYYAGKRDKELVHPHNRRHRVHLRFQGKTYTFKSLSQKTGITVKALYNRYYNHHLRGNKLVHPGLLSAKFDIHGKTYDLPKLTHRYHTNIAHILKVIRPRYRAGQRGHDLILPFEMENGPISFHHHHFTPEELGRQYGLPAKEINKRYYKQNKREQELVQPLDNPNQLKLTDTTTQERPPRKSVAVQKTDTQVAHRKPQKRLLTIHGSAIGRPQYKHDAGHHLYASLLVIVGQEERRAQRMFPGGFVNCVAKDGEAQRIHHLAIYYSPVTVSGDIQVTHYHGHRQNELIAQQVHKNAR